jgi:hypothetical protein
MQQTVATLIVGALILAACSGSAESNENSDVSTASSSTTLAPTTTSSTTISSTTSSTSSTTTTTITAPTTTVAGAAYDIETIDLNTLLAWAEAEDVDSEYLFAVSESCEGAVVGLGRISQILFDGAIESLDLTSAAWDGDALVSDAASAFEKYQEALIWGAAVATAFPTNPEVGGASVFAAELGEALSSLLMNSTYLIGSVFDEDAGTIDSGAYNTWVVEMRSSLFPLVTMSHVSPDSYC